MKKVALIILVCMLSVASILLYIYFDSHHPKHFEVDFLNIGQGDAALIKFANGQKMLIDCGPNRIILSALGRQLPFYDRTIDYVLATHPDLDHYGGCIDVLQHYNVKNIIVNGREKAYDPYWREWNRTMHRREPGANIITITSPTIWTIASDTLQFLSPDPALDLKTALADSNNYSIVFKLTHGSETFLFTGDMEVPLENELMKKYCSSAPPLGPTRGRSAQNDNVCHTIRTDVLKVAHHGSDTGSSVYFLSLVQPKRAIISVGKNKYGHPSRRILKRLERVGAEVLRTDEKDDIVIQ